jgi:hypothetical protein
VFEKSIKQQIELENADFVDVTVQKRLKITEQRWVYARLDSNMDTLKLPV